MENQQLEALVADALEQIANNPPPPQPNAEAPIPANNSSMATGAPQAPQASAAPSAPGRFVIVERPQPRVIPPIIERKTPRDPYTEPPTMVEIIQQCDRPNLGRHPRAYQYPEHWTYAMVMYCEDPFWTERTVPLPPNVRVPPRPYDYWDVREVTPPPEDFNWVPPDMPPPIPIPDEAYLLYYQRRAEHFRLANQDGLSDENDENKPNGN